MFLHAEVVSKVMDTTVLHKSTFDLSYHRNFKLVEIGSKLIKGDNGTLGIPG